MFEYNMVYATFDGQKLNRSLKRSALDDRPVLYFFIQNDLSEKPYEPATDYKTYDRLPKDPSLNPYSTDGLPRLCLYPSEAKDFIAYCKKKNPQTNASNLHETCRTFSNTKRELQNCFGLKALRNMQNRLADLLDTNSL